MSTCVGILLLYFPQVPGELRSFSVNHVAHGVVGVVADVEPPVFADSFLVAGHGFLWIEIFIDGFSMSKSRGALSSEGIYVSLSNTRRDSKHAQCFIGTLSLVPHGVDPLSLLRHVSDDLRQLQTGVDVFDSLDNTVRTIRGAISMLPADHVQVMRTTRALGNTALLTGRCCWSTISERCMLSQMRSGVFLEHHMTRRDAQTDVCLKQINATRRREDLSAPQVTRLQTSYGVRALPGFFHPAVLVDTHMQSFWDSSHLTAE